MKLQTWCDYLDSREIPLRSGAIRELTAALRQNKLTEEQSDKVEKNCMAIVKMQIEPFLFLSAVQALTVIVLKRKEIFDNLVEFLRSQASKDAALAVQIGEVLSRACKNLAIWRRATRRRCSSQTRNLTAKDTFGNIGCSS